nr:hypothetical protein CFP56_59626 [Quercus suber]
MELRRARNVEPRHVQRLPRSQYDANRDMIDSLSRSAVFGVSTDVIDSLYPFPLFGWFIISGLLWLCPHAVHLARYVIKIVWLTVGFNMVKEPQLSNFSPWLQQPLVFLDKCLGPRNSPVSRILAVWIPAVELWLEVPLAHGWRHPNVWIAAAAFLVMLGMHHRWK